jgi:hypothetical protein
VQNQIDLETAHLREKLETQTHKDLSESRLPTPIHRQINHHSEGSRTTGRRLNFNRKENFFNIRRRRNTCLSNLTASVAAVIKIITEGTSPEYANSTHDKRCQEQFDKTSPHDK